MEARKTIPQTESNCRDETDFVNKAFINNNNISKNDYNYSQSISKVEDILPNCFMTKVHLKDRYPNSLVNDKIKFKDRLSTFGLKRKSTQKSISTDKDNINCKEINKHEDRLKNKEIQKVKSATKVTPTTSTTSTSLVSSDYVSSPFRKSPQIPQYKFVKRLLGAHREFAKVRESNIPLGSERSYTGMHLERFKNFAKEEDSDLNSTVIELQSIDIACNQNSNTGNKQKITFDSLALNQFHGDNCLAIKTIRLLSRSLGGLRLRRKQSVDISSPDPEFKVSYLGNVLTGWTKGDACVEKQLNTLWRNYMQNNKPDVIMCIKVCASGLKATTRQHGLTEYWSNRITHCCVPKNYPRIFCWIYRHEARKLKHELRCHAILCSKQKIVNTICDTLKANLKCALREFKREKILRQNARLSLANSVNEYPSLPKRKILLSVGSNNYRSPLERSKSAPKLMAIEEAIGEEGEEIEDTNEPDMRSCCQKDSLYPSMTLGRRRCRRGHSIRRTGKVRPLNFHLLKNFRECNIQNNEISQKIKKICEDNIYKLQAENNEQSQNGCNSDDSDDVGTILKHHKYDTNGSLSNELMPYLDRQFRKQGSKCCNKLASLTDSIEEEDETLILLPAINNNPNAHPDIDTQRSEIKQISQISENFNQECRLLTNVRASNDICSDGEDDYLIEYNTDGNVYFHATNMLNIIYRNSIKKMSHLSLSSDEGNSSLETHSSNNSEILVQQHIENHNLPSQRIYHQKQSSTSFDSSGLIRPKSVSRKQTIGYSIDEDSISSGCETASTATNYQDDNSLRCRNNWSLECASIDIPKKFDVAASQISNNNETMHWYNNSSSKTAIDEFNNCTSSGISCNTIGNDLRNYRRHSQLTSNSDSDCSDESGYVEYSEKAGTLKTINRQTDSLKHSHNLLEYSFNLKRPPISPKPMPKGALSATSSTTI